MLVNAKPVAKGGKSHRAASGGKPGCLGRGDPAFCVSASRLRLLFDSIIESITGPDRLIVNQKVQASGLTRGNVPAFFFHLSPHQSFLALMPKKAPLS